MIAKQVDSLLTAPVHKPYMRTCLTYLFQGPVGGVAQVVRAAES